MSPLFVPPTFSPPNADSPSTGSQSVKPTFKNITNNPPQHGGEQSVKATVKDIYKPIQFCDNSGTSVPLLIFLLFGKMFMYT